ncbi:MAG: DoxX protein [Aequorivita sp.]
MKNNQSLKTWLRVLLGLFLIVYALNQFFHFMPTSYGKMPENAMEFLDAVLVYLPMLYIFEIILGLFLVFNKWTPFLLIVLFPLSVAFLIFSISNQDFLDALPALIVALLNFILLLFEKEKYKPLFTK